VLLEREVQLGQMATPELLENLDLRAHLVFRVLLASPGQMATRESEEGRGPQDHKGHLESQVEMGMKVIQAIKDHRVSQELRVKLAIQETRENQVVLVHMDQGDQRVLQEREAQLDHKEKRDTREMLDPKVPQVLLAGQELVGNLVRMVSQVTGVLMEHLVLMVDLETLVHQDKREMLASQDQLVDLGDPEKMVDKEMQVLLALMVMLGTQASLEPRDRRAHKGSRVNVVRRVKLATLDCLEPRVCVAQWDLMGSLVPVDYLVQMESLDSMANLERLELLVRLVIMVHLVMLVLVDFLEKMAKMDHEVSLEEEVVLASLVLLALLGLMVSMVPLAKRDHLV